MNVKRTRYNTIFSKIVNEKIFTGTPVRSLQGICDYIRNPRLVKSWFDPLFRVCIITSRSVDYVWSIYLNVSFRYYKLWGNIFYFVLLCSEFRVRRNVSYVSSITHPVVMLRAVGEHGTCTHSKSWYRSASQNQILTWINQDT